MSKKKTLTQDQEFEVLKLVLDKLLWLGIIIIAYGLYNMINQASPWPGLWTIVGGAVLTLIFMSMLVRKFEYSK